MEGEEAKDESLSRAEKKETAWYRDRNILRKKIRRGEKGGGHQFWIHVQGKQIQGIII